MQEITSLEMLQDLKREENALLVLFGGRECNVCHSIKPKLIALIEVRYPKIKMVYVDCHEVTDMCAQEGVFTLPTLQVFFTGQRFIEEVRSFSLQKVVQEIERPYQLLFES